MLLAYIINRTISKDKNSFSIPLVFAAAIMPDLDFAFSPFFAHHTITHSITFWSLVYAPILIIKRRKALPYAIATFSHFVIGDVITGNPPLLLGITDFKFGFISPWIATNFGISYSMLYQAIIDAIMVGIFLMLCLWKREEFLPREWMSNIWHVLLLIGIVFVVFIGAYKNDIAFALEKNDVIFQIAYSIIAVSHLVFVIVLIKSVGSINNMKQILPISKNNNNNEAGDNRKTI
jgi:hypothetical protein